ncbi:MAG: DMT family transporter [Candidatus Micrarchaeota archaeon]|nr:DMT family transporter [Candidatus Micrarchaeota archaeon]
MLGILFAALSALTSGCESILHRYVLVKEDSIGYAFVWHCLTALLFLPLFLIEFKLPTEQTAWLFVIASSVFWACASFAGFKAYSQMEVSSKSLIGRTKVLFSFLLALLFLRETISAEKILGVVLIFAGLILLTYKKSIGFSDLKSKGVSLTILSAFFVSCALIIDKFATQFFPLGMYSFIVYALPVVFLVPFALQRKADVKSIVKNKFAATLGTVILGAASYYFILNAFKFAEASVVIPIAELSMLVTVAGGALVLREKVDAKKIIAAVVVIAGAVLLSGVFRF